MTNKIKREKINYLKKELKYELKKNDLSANAAQLTFYILLSLLPMLLVVSNAIILFPITQEKIFVIARSIMPSEVYLILNPIFKSILDSVNGVTISFGLLTALWSASRCFSTIQGALNNVYGTKKRRNFIVTRIFSFVMSLIVITLFGMLIFLFTFGENIMETVKRNSYFKLLSFNFTVSSWFVTVIFLFTLFIVLFYFVPNVKWKIKFSIPGAIFSTIGILFGNQLIRLYITFFGDSFLGLGSMSLFIVFMLWLYLSMIIFLWGALINVIYHKYSNEKNSYKNQFIK
ncbi:YihY/virulence factor BrkB family protein [Carnobacterium maltaromaticum]|uniref:YihY/virulence factor BrkB family protein n=1 Tax=Carnobacterium maltaromaticum TaxID=2751 RepID=UPI00295E2205|nr:YihY/virulence factor BrkB family protein [Carnobacterium maltaromaticum]